RTLLHALGNGAECGFGGGNQLVAAEAVPVHERERETPAGNVLVLPLDGVGPAADVVAADVAVLRVVRRAEHDEDLAAVRAPAGTSAGFAELLGREADALEELL